MYERQLALYDKLVSMTDKFERKGKTMPYTSANGYMFSLLNKDAELGIRLSKEAQKKFLEDYYHLDRFYLTELSCAIMF